LAARDESIVLVTAATPFGGFLIASLSVLDFGLGPESFHNLGSLSSFIRSPGTLGPNVKHVKVETDETGQRRRIGAAWIGDDLVGLGHQRHPIVDQAAERRVTLRLGHVEVLNDGGRVPAPLSAELDQALGPIQPGRAHDEYLAHEPAPNEATDSSAPAVISRR